MMTTRGKRPEEPIASLAGAIRLSRNIFGRITQLRQDFFAVLSEGGRRAPRCQCLAVNVHGAAEHLDAGASRDPELHIVDQAPHANLLLVQRFFDAEQAPGCARRAAVNFNSRATHGGKKIPLSGSAQLQGRVELHAEFAPVSLTLRTIGETRVVNQVLT